jgi:hypothetical protein
MGKKLKIAVAPYRASDSGPCTHALHWTRPSHAQTWSETAILNMARPSHAQTWFRNGFYKHQYAGLQIHLFRLHLNYCGYAGKLHV